MTASDASASRAFQTALELFDVGVKMMRQNLRRSHPGANEQHVEAMLRAWLLQRPGAEYGDSAGVPADVETRLE
jgi:hypothetical protein